MISSGSMNVVLKNNRELLKNGKRKPFTKTVGGYNKSSNYKRYVLPEVQPHTLRRIRLKVKRQNRRILIKKIITAVVAILLFMLWMLF